MTVRLKGTPVQQSLFEDDQKTAQEKYVNSRGEFCPSCGHDQKLEATALDGPTDGIIHRDLSCSSCGAKWTEQFAIVGFSNFRADQSRDKKAARRARRLARKAAQAL